MSEIKAAASSSISQINAIQEQLNSQFKGKRVRILRDFHDQPWGRSKPNLKGCEYTIQSVGVDAYNCWVFLQGLSCGISPDSIQVIS